MAARAKAARTTARKAGQAAAGARANPYVQRFIEDEELRDNVRTAVDHAQKAYRRMSNGKGPAKALMEDRKLHKELRETADSLREAGEGLRGKRKRRRGRKLLMLAILGGIAFVLINEGTRKTLLDKIFGAEEEFEYTSTTSP